MADIEGVGAVRIVSTLMAGIGDGDAHGIPETRAAAGAVQTRAASKGGVVASG